ncbi:MAG TPA: pyridoxine 5'-phosphate synthase, partial [Campylobacterales bacterium]|nr:pyridoxine 5'-phosphate synthase [Campylobacterales bacterium]
AMLYGNLRHTPHSIKALEVERSKLQKMLVKSVKDLQDAAEGADDYGLKVAAGHGLNYLNVDAICKIDLVQELNIGQSIIARSLFTGFENAVKEMVTLIK